MKDSQQKNKEGFSCPMCGISFKKFNPVLNKLYTCSGCNKKFWVVEKPKFTYYL